MSGIEASLPPGVADDIAAVWKDFQGLADVGAVSYMVNTKGGQTGSVVLLVDGLKPAAIKIREPGNRRQDHVLFREAAYLCLLGEAVESSPLHIPQPIEICTDRGEPQYLAMEQARGHVLGNDEVKQFSADEKRVFGWAIGTFAAWMLRVVETDQYYEILYYSTTEVYDRVSEGPYARFGNTVPLIQEAGCSRLRSALLETLEELGDYLWFPSEPRFIGHDDIKPLNMSFEYDKGFGGWKPASIFDFELMKPTTPDREFRHLRMIDGRISDAAAEAFEEATGYKVYSDDIDFWARYQAVTAMASCIRVIMQDRPDVNTASFQTIVRDNYRAVQEVLPDNDWSELDRFVGSVN